MKALAEYVMRGPKEASIAVFILGLIPVFGPWLCVAALSLVILQIGMEQGAKVIPWAVLPAIGWFVAGDVTFLMILLASAVAAGVLRAMRSLPLAITVAVVMTAAMVSLVQVLMPHHLEALAKMMSEILASSENFEAAADNVGSVDREQLIEKLISVTFAWGTGFTACLVLFVARWWQSLLYKPGGFQQEFHQFRLSYRLVFVLLLSLVLAVQLQKMGIEFGLALAALFSIPILIAAIALVHGVIKILDMNSHWLGMFYVSLFFMGHLLYLPLLMLAILDASIDIRMKVSKAISDDSDGSSD